MEIENDKRILVISNIGCGPPFMGNRIRMRELLKQIKNLGYVIHFAGICLNDEEIQSVEPHIDFWITNFKRREKNKWIEVIRKTASSFIYCFGFNKKLKKKINYELDDFFEDRWLEEVCRIQEINKYNRVLIPYIFNSKFFNAFQNSTVKILDTHDLFGNRNQILQKLGIENLWFSTTIDDEKRGLQRANKIIAIQHHEEEYFRKLAEDQAEVRTVSHFIEPQFLSISPQSYGIFGFIGSENPLNVNGLRWFIYDVLPLVKQKIPEFKFLIGGGICRKIEKNEDYELLGKIDSINDFYKACSFTINPIQAGTGLKIKTIESIAFGRPVVSSSNGAVGLESFINNGVCVADKPEQFAEHIITYLAHDDELIRSIQNSRKIIRMFNSVSLENLTDILHT